ncbi:MAG: nucleolar RNA-binding Nop10p family protein [Candidatus Nanoarchaeia archaeon]
MKLRNCKECNIYTLKEKCPNCNKKTSDAHYKFIKYSKKQDNIADTV